MVRATLIRVLLSLCVAIIPGIRLASAQSIAPPPPPPPPTNLPPPTPPVDSTPPLTAPTIPGPQGGGGHRNNIVPIVVLAVGGAIVVLGAVSWLLHHRRPPDRGPPIQPPPPPPQPGTQVAQTQLPPQPPQGGRPPPRLRRGFDLPRAGVTAYVPNEVLVDIPASVSARTLNLIERRHAVTPLETITIRLTGRRLHLWRLSDSSTVTQMIPTLATEPAISGAQPNYLFEMAQEQAEPLNADQYAPQKIDVPEAHRLARGERVRVAVIDSEIDASHPDLAGTIASTFETTADKEPPHPHGTGMAGAIAAHRTMLGIAPRAEILAVRAFSASTNNAEGTTFNIIKGIDWAAAQNARIINMSFAGPPDPRLSDVLARASRKGIVLIAAAGNAGPNSPPLFPAANPNVIAVTATDPDDALFEGSNRGNYIAIAAPGVDVLVPAPGGTYQLTTGTSVAAAEISGVAALLLQRNPSLTPADVRRILMGTSKDLGPKGRDRDFGAGLVDALRAVTAARARPGG